MAVVLCSKSCVASNYLQEKTEWDVRSILFHFTLTDGFILLGLFSLQFTRNNFSAAFSLKLIFVLNVI